MHINTYQHTYDSIFTYRHCDDFVPVNNKHFIEMITNSFDIRIYIILHNKTPSSSNQIQIHQFCILKMFRIMHSVYGISIIGLENDDRKKKQSERERKR